MKRIIITLLCLLLMLSGCFTKKDEDQNAEEIDDKEINNKEEDNKEESSETDNEQISEKESDNTEVDTKTDTDQEVKEETDDKDNKEIDDKKPDNSKDDSEENNKEEIDDKETDTEETNNEQITLIKEESGLYVYFGSYPQCEVVSSVNDSGVYSKEWATNEDYIVDADLYNVLSNLTEDKWSLNGDATIDGNKYRRIKKEDTTYSTIADPNYYDWSSDGYHYFKYEPIKWRVLEQNNDEVFLLSEMVLDDQMYNSVITNMNWETSTIRSWLNGYDSNENLYGTDYSSNNFLDTAFSDLEQVRILNTTIENADNVKNGTEGGNDTTDKIYLLSEAEVYGEKAVEYGFASNYRANDTARISKSSTYAKAMGAYVECENDNLGNCYWWLRSPGSYTGLFILIRCDGGVYRGGQHANSKTRGVRPAMRISIK